MHPSSAAPILVSACLCGTLCRYDGTASPHPDLVRLCAHGLAVAVCPELLGELPVPRAACERRGEQVVDVTGRDVTDHFLLGAQKTLALAQEHAITVAVLKERSPSCGSTAIYDGTFRGTLIPGRGVATALLRRHGISVFSEENFLSAAAIKKYCPALCSQGKFRGNIPASPQGRN